jgi:hypothetical protein
LNRFGDGDQARDQAYLRVFHFLLQSCTDNWTFFTIFLRLRVWPRLTLGSNPTLFCNPIEAGQSCTSSDLEDWALESFICQE